MICTAEDIMTAKRRAACGHFFHPKQCRELIEGTQEHLRQTVVHYDPTGCRPFLAQHVRALEETLKDNEWLAAENKRLKGQVERMRRHRERERSGVEG